MRTAIEIIAAYIVFTKGLHARMPIARKHITRGKRYGRAPQARANRRRIALASAAALSIALGTAFSVATFTGVDLASAAVQRAKTFSDLLNARSPGERTEGQLSNTKHRHAILAERDAEPVDIKQPLKNFAEALLPTAPPTVTIDASPQVPEFALQLPPPPVFFTPPGGGIITPSGGGVVTPPGGGTTPPGGPGGPPNQPPLNPPPPPTPPPPPLPEPGTWMMMILGFGMVGLALRRDARMAQVAS